MSRFPRWRPQAGRTPDEDRTPQERRELKDRRVLRQHLVALPLSALGVALAASEWRRAVRAGEDPRRRRIQLERRAGLLAVELWVTLRNLRLRRQDRSGPPD